MPSPQSSLKCKASPDLAHFRWIARAPTLSHKQPAMKALNLDGECLFPKGRSHSQYHVTRLLSVYSRINICVQLYSTAPRHLLKQFPKRMPDNPWTLQGMTTLVYLDVQSTQAHNGLIALSLSLF